MGKERILLTVKIYPTGASPAGCCWKRRPRPAAVGHWKAKAVFKLASITDSRA